MDSMIDHLVPLIASQETTKKMYDALKKLYENENPSRILALKDQLRQVKLTKDDSISSYLWKITWIKDQLAVVDESVSDRDLVLTSMGGLPSEWNPFVKGIYAHGQLPTFDQFWSECIQEKTRELASTSKEKEELVEQRQERHQVSSKSKDQEG